jgi:hypothetical protein
MPSVRFEPTIPVLERAKTVHALGRAATVIGKWYIMNNWEDNDRQVTQEIPRLL